MKKTALAVFCSFFIFAAFTPFSYGAQDALDIANSDGIDENISEADITAVYGPYDFEREEIILEFEENENGGLGGIVCEKKASGGERIEKSEEIIVINDEIVSKNPSLAHLSKPVKKKIEPAQDAKQEESALKKENKELPIIGKKVQQAYKSFISIGFVASALDFISELWQKTKKFIKSLPGIRHYLNSKYSKENYKKELSGPAIEVNKTDLKKQDTPAMNMLQEDGVNEKVLEKTTSTGKKVKVQPL